MRALTSPPLPVDRLEVVSGFGLSSQAVAYVFRPRSAEELEEAFALARASGRSLALRGAGRSYGDAAINAENIVVDLCDMNRIERWDPTTGEITLEPGVTVRQLWERILPDGWWPPVVPGTMFPTIGGAAAMNIHGKNNFKVGPIGDHILSFDLLLPGGEIRHCSREENLELFHAAIGGFGMLGVFTRLTLRMKRIHSGLLDVAALATTSLGSMRQEFEARMERADYLVGWIDALASGSGAGRGVLHEARFLAPGEDPEPATTLTIERQVLPDRIFGLFPKSLLWRLMRPLTNDAGIALINRLKYASSRLFDRDRRFRQSHVAFAFLLDYVPEWRRSYGPGGLIQYQSFVPADRAVEVFEAQMDLARRRGIPPYLAVFKRHRRDDFLMSHAVDGYSLALDFRVTRGNRERVWRLAGDLDNMVLDASGRFYFAKDSTLRPEAVERFLGSEAVATFRRLKRECDPDDLLQTDLSRRLFPGG